MRRFSNAFVANWKSIRFSSWFDQTDIPKVEIPEEPVIQDIAPRMQQMYMPPVEEVEDPEKKDRWTVEPSAYDLWSVHGTRQSSVWRPQDILPIETKKNLLKWVDLNENERLMVSSIWSHEDLDYYRFERVKIAPDDARKLLQERMTIGWSEPEWKDYWAKMSKSHEGDVFGNGCATNHLSSDINDVNEPSFIDIETYKGASILDWSLVHHQMNNGAVHYLRAHPKYLRAHSKERRMSSTHPKQGKTVPVLTARLKNQRHGAVWQPHKIVHPPKTPTVKWEDLSDKEQVWVNQLDLASKQPEDFVYRRLTMAPIDVKELIEAKFNNNIGWSPERWEDFWKDGSAGHKLCGQADDCFRQAQERLPAFIDWPNSRKSEVVSLSWSLLHHYMDQGVPYMEVLDGDTEKQAAANEDQLPLFTDDDDKAAEAWVEKENAKQRSPLSEFFDFRNFEVKRDYRNNKCMNNIMTCEHGSKMAPGHEMTLVIGKGPFEGQRFRYHRGGYCQEMATDYLHRIVQRPAN